MRFSGFVVLALLVSAWARADFKVGLVLDKGGKDDKSFNSAAYKGAMKAKDEAHLFVKYVEATDDNEVEPMLRAFAQKDFDLIVAIGVSQQEAMKKVASQFPQKHFAIVDAVVDLPNVSSLLFEEHQGSYLVGAIAALMSKSGKIGFIGGMDIPLIRRFEMGFKAGAMKENPKIQLTSNFIGVSSDAWNNPAKAKELALSQYGEGTDVIFAAAGASNGGLFDAAEETKKLAIGVDSNQDYLKPGFILTSMLKRVDTAVEKTSVDSSQGKFSPGQKRFGLSDGGIDYSVDEFNEKVLPKTIRVKVDALKAQIIAGKIKVPDYYNSK